MSTKSYCPWELIGYETYVNKEEAKEREKSLKRNRRMQCFFKKRLLAAKEVVRVEKIILIICGMFLMGGNFAMAQNNEVKKSVIAKQPKTKIGKSEVDLDRFEKEKPSNKPEIMLIEESSLAIPSSIYSVMPCEGLISEKCLMGFIDGKQGRGGKFKVMDKFGSLLLDRSVPHFREGWVRPDGEVVIVEYGEQGKTFSVKRLTLSGKEKGEFTLPFDNQLSEEFDYNAAGNGDLFAVNVDTVIYLDGSTRMRPKSWKKFVMNPLYWYLLPDASIIVSSGRSRNGGKEESARIDINGEILWKHPRSLTLPNHIKRRAVQMPKYLFAWGKENKTLSLVNVDNGELYWEVMKVSESFGVSFITMSPSQRYLVLSVAHGRPKIQIVLADIQKKEIIVRQKLPKGLHQMVFDFLEERIFMFRKIWSRPKYRSDIIRKRNLPVPLKIKIEVVGINLQKKDKAYELDINAGKFDDTHLLLLSNDKLGFIDSFSNKIRTINSHE